MATAITLNPTEQIAIDIHESLVIRQMYYLSHDLFNRLVDQLPENPKHLTEFDQLVLHKMDIVGDFVTKLMELIRVIEKVHLETGE